MKHDPCTIIKQCEVEGCENPRDKAQNRKICTMHRVRFGRHKSFEIPEKQLPEGISKICIHHGELKEDDVYIAPGKKDKKCKLCIKIRMAKNWSEHKQRENNMTRNYLHVGKTGNRIKILRADYDILLLAQNSVCAICYKLESIGSYVKGQPKRLAIDHNHKTGYVRGLLCHSCNVSIGSMNDSIELLQSAITYLKRYENQTASSCNTELSKNYDIKVKEINLKCMVPECDATHINATISKGICQKHKTRMRKYGDYNIASRKEFLSLS